MNWFCERLIDYVVKRYGARETVCWIIGEFLPLHHLSKNPRKRVSDEVMETRVEA